MSAGSTITQFFRDVNDATRVRWQSEDALDFLNDAVMMVFNLRPDAFTVTKEVTLIAGSKQPLIGCVDLLTVSQNTGGVDGRPISRGNLEMLRTYTSKSCSTPRTAEQIAAYEVDQWFYDQRDPETWYVAQPVPQGVDKTVQMTCREAPIQYSAGGLGLQLQTPRYRPAILDWMKRRAYGVDSESLTSYNLMSFHDKAFYQSIGVAYRADSQTQSGFAVGRVGIGDKAVVRP